MILLVCLIVQGAKTTELKYPIELQNVHYYYRLFQKT